MSSFGPCSGGLLRSRSKCCRPWPTEFPRTRPNIARPFRPTGFRSKLVQRSERGLKRHDRSQPVNEAERLADALPAAETLRSLIEQVPVTVYIDRLDDISSNVFMSPQLEAVLGYTANEWASDPEFYVKVIHPDDLQRVLAEHRRTRETGDLSMEYRMVARDG